MSGTPLILLPEEGHDPVTTKRMIKTIAEICADSTGARCVARLATCDIRHPMRLRSWGLDGKPKRKTQPRDFEFVYRGLECQVVFRVKEITQHLAVGHYCGYVKIDPRFCDVGDHLPVDVHGGIIYDDAYIGRFYSSNNHRRIW